MIDYILTFPTEKDAIKFFDAYNHQTSIPYLRDITSIDENGKQFWDTSRVVPNVSIVIQQPTYQLDSNGNTVAAKDGGSVQIKPRLTQPGWYMWITTDKLYSVLDPVTFAKAWRGFDSKLLTALNVEPMPVTVATYSMDKV